MKKIILIILFLIGAKNILASPIINEIYPAPQSGEFEWIEIYNDESAPLYINNYYLTDLAGNKIKWTTETIDAFSFTLATSSSVLNNSGDTLFIKNNLNEIIDIATYSGTLDSFQSTARCPDGGNNWLSTIIITKNSSNLPACFALTPTSPAVVLTEAGPTITSIPTATPFPLPTRTSYDNISLSEAMVNPAAGENEWIEIYNGNDFIADLTNWYIDDAENAGSSSKKFSLAIPAKSYKVFNLTSPVFNNDKDSVRLLDFNKTLKDDFEYYTSTTGQTYGRVLFGEDFCLQLPSFEAVNNSCLTPLVLVESNTMPTITPTKVPSPTKPIAVTVKPIKYQTKHESNAAESGEVLGIAEKKTFRNSTVTRLSFLSFSYSLLTILTILFKMKFKYGTRKKILLSFFYPSRGE